MLMFETRWCVPETKPEKREQTSPKRLEFMFHLWPTVKTGVFSNVMLVNYINYINDIILVMEIIIFTLYALQIEQATIFSKKHHIVHSLILGR